MKKGIRGIIAALSFGLVASFPALAGGVIVVDEQEGPSPTSYFVSVKHSDGVAARDALGQCREHGGNSCLVAVRFEKCGALADSSRFYRVGKGASIQEASANALKDCPGCRIVQAACDETRLAAR